MTDAEPHADRHDEERADRDAHAEEELSPGATLDGEDVAEPNEPA